MERGRTLAHTEELLQKRLDGEVLKPCDRALCQEIVYGVVRRQRTLDWLVERKAPGRRQVPSVRIVLHMGLYQLLWLDRIPNHAAVHESVELLRSKGLVGAAGFVNAVLRAYATDRETTRASLKALEETEPGIATSHPDWMIRRWQARWGVETTRKLLEWNNQGAVVFGRINTLKASPEDTTHRWTTEGLQFENFNREWFPADWVYRFQSLAGLHGLGSFNKGLFYVQDPSTLMSVQMLDPKPGDRVLDFCAAPGGKTTCIAQCLQNQGLILALDPDAKRLERLQENCLRMGVTCATTMRPDQFAAKHGGHLFDKVLVDAPCSNTGVLRRRVDVRWRLSLQSILSQTDHQLAILSKASESVRPQGSLVYSTCSLEPEENRDLVFRFLAEHPGFALVKDRELSPVEEGVDGAYAALLRRS